LLRLCTRAGTLHAHDPAHRVDTRLRVRVPARDVSVDLRTDTDTCVLDIHSAVLQSLSPLPNGQFYLQLLAGALPLLARVSHQSALHLQLCECLACGRMSSPRHCWSEARRGTARRQIRPGHACALRRMG